MGQERWDKARNTIESALKSAKDISDMKNEQLNYSNLSKLTRLAEIQREKDELTGV